MTVWKHPSNNLKRKKNFSAPRTHKKWNRRCHSISLIRFTTASDSFSIMATQLNMDITQPVSNLRTYGTSAMIRSSPTSTKKHCCKSSHSLYFMRNCKPETLAKIHLKYSFHQEVQNTQNTEIKLHNKTFQLIKVIYFSTCNIFFTATT